ncbi:hypothetical protein TMatcc_003713 [Talaromyces marneffei ATCC 18224]
MIIESSRFDNMPKRAGQATYGRPDDPFHCLDMEAVAVTPSILRRSDRDSPVASRLADSGRALASARAVGK